MREQILAQIAAERIYQEHKFGNDSDDTFADTDWDEIIKRCLINPMYTSEQQYLKAAAVCVAAIEASARQVSRDIENPIAYHSAQSRKLRVYISGPMTGIPSFNQDAFNNAATRLREQGYEVVNPAKNFGGNISLPREVYMRLDITQILSVDVLVVLPGWKESKGATLETSVAKEIGLPVTTLEEILNGE